PARRRLGRRPRQRAPARHPRPPPRGLTHPLLRPSRARPVPLARGPLRPPPPRGPPPPPPRPPRARPVPLGPRPLRRRRPRHPPVSHPPTGRRRGEVPGGAVDRRTPRCRRSATTPLRGARPRP